LKRVVEVLETMGDIFFALDPQWRLALVNRNYEKYTRTRREDTVGRIFWELYPDAAAPESVYWREYHRCSQERVAVQFLDYYAPLGFWADVRAYPTSDGGIAVFIRDVSAEKRAEERLKRQTEFEQQLIGIVSHDLRNPLNAILLSSSILKRREELSDKDIKGVVRIQNSAERAARMVNDLLDFTQARLGGGIPIEPRQADLRSLTRNVIDEVEAAYPGRELIISHDGETQGSWDPDRLGQVLQNLATNALKYSPEGSAVRISTSTQDGWISLSVHNQGAPIAAQLLPGIFEPMRRGTNEVDHSGRSIGLGLYIVKQVVEAHKGTVEVRSDEASGTTFTVRLPRS
jgi:phosphoserine phosphatase RsbU/P